MEPTVMQWASQLYSREVCGDIYEAEVQSGKPVEIPLSHEAPETLEQAIQRIVAGYRAMTGNDVEDIDEANDFYIPGEDEDYIEDDLIVDQQEQEMTSKLPQSNKSAAPVSQETGAEPPPANGNPEAGKSAGTDPAQ